MLRRGCSWPCVCVPRHAPHRLSQNRHASVREFLHCRRDVTRLSMKNGTFSVFLVSHAATSEQAIEKGDASFRCGENRRGRLDAMENMQTGTFVAAAILG